MSCPAQAVSGQYGSTPATNGALLKLLTQASLLLGHAIAMQGYLELFGVSLGMH